VRGMSASAQPCEISVSECVFSLAHVQAHKRPFNVSWSWASSSSAQWHSVSGGSRARAAMSTGRPNS